MASRAGAHAGRGFRYQDAVAARLAVTGWTGDSRYGLVIPEGDDDIEVTSQTGRTLVQVKSRREHRGSFSLLEIDGYLRKLWSVPAPLPTDFYLLILERQVTGSSLGLEPSPLDGFKMLIESMQLNRQAADAPSRTYIWIMQDPRGDSRQLIESVKTCTPVEADAYYGSVLRRAGALADDNGMRKSGAYLGLSSSDVELEFNRIAPAFASDRTQAALSRGICEAVDFSTPLEDVQFFAGVDVQPGHVVAGLLVERTEIRDAVVLALHSQRNVLLKGPSGAGKSALQWDAAYSTRHSVRWFRVRRLVPADIADLVVLANSCCASAESPVGFLLDNVSANLIDGWNSLAREVAIQPRLRLLASIREEDIYPLAERREAVEISVSTEEDFAEIFWSELRKRGQTSWTNWQEPWSLSNRLLLEYAHILTQGDRLAKTLHQQVASRATDKSRSVELDVLRICAAITAVGARVDTVRLAAVLSHTAFEIGASLPRLVNEHLLRDLGNGSIGGLHEIRSLHLLNSIGEVSLESTEQTFQTALGAVLDSDVGIFLNRVLGWHPTSEEAMLTLLGARVSQNPSAQFVTSILNGLGERQITEVIEAWFSSDEVGAVPASLLSIAVMFGTSGVELPEIFGHTPIAPAIHLMARLKRESFDSNLRIRFLHRIKVQDMEIVFKGVDDVASLDALLAAFVGQSLPPHLADTLISLSPALLKSDLSSVKELLGTAYLLDPRVAQSWVSQVGASKLLARIDLEVPWATSANVVQVPEGVGAKADIRFAPSRYQLDTHHDVVSLCELLLALCPTADIAISNAIAGDGLPLGFNGVSLAQKRIARSNLPPASLPSWNRRWGDAVNVKLAPRSYGDYLQKMCHALSKLYAALTTLVDGLFRGTVAPKILTRLGELHELAEATSSPFFPSLATALHATGGGKEKSKLQQVLFDCSADLIRRFTQLPEGGAAYIGWAGDLLMHISASIENEPWQLTTSSEDGPKVLTKLADLVNDMRHLAGESTVTQRSPTTTHRKKVAKVGQALPQVREAIRKRVKTRTIEMERALKESFDVLSPGAHVFVRPSVGDMPLWPLVDVLVTFNLEKIDDWPVIMLLGWKDWRAIVPSGYSLVAMPVVSGFAVTKCAVGQFDTPFPAETEAQGWLRQAKLTAAPDLTARLWSSFLDAAVDVAIIESQGFGTANRPELEKISRSDARARLAATSESMTGRVPQILQSMASTIVDVVNSQPRALVDSQLALLRNELDAVGEVLLDAQFACYSIDLGTAPVPN